MAEASDSPKRSEGDNNKEHNDRMAAALAITMLASTTSADVTESCVTSNEKNPSKQKKRRQTVAKARKKKVKNTNEEALVGSSISSLDAIFSEAISGNTCNYEMAEQPKQTDNVSERTDSTIVMKGNAAQSSNKDVPVEVKNRRLPPKKRKVIDMEIETEKLKDKLMTLPMKLVMASSLKDIPTPVDNLDAGESDGGTDVHAETKRPIDNQYPSVGMNTNKSGFQPVDPCRNMQILNDCQKALTPDDDGDLSIHIAVVQGEIDVVKRLIDLMKAFNKTLDTYNKLRQTALHLSVLTENELIIQLLLEHRADPNLPDRRGRNCLHMAIERGRLDILDLIMKKTQHKIDLDAKTFEGLTPLHVAVEQKDLKAADLLYRYGSDVNAEDSKSGRTCIHYAAEANNIEMVKLLIKCKADLNVCSYAGVYPYQIAANRGYTDVKYLLQASGANVNAKVDIAYPPKKGKRRHSASMEVSVMSPTALKIPIPRLPSQHTMSQPSTPTNTAMNTPATLDLPPPLIYVKPSDSVPVSRWMIPQGQNDSSPVSPQSDTQISKTSHENTRNKIFRQTEKPKLRHSRSLDCDVAGRPLSPVSPPGGVKKPSFLPGSPRTSKTPPGRLRFRLSKQDVKNLQEQGVNLSELFGALQKGNFNEARNLMLAAQKTAIKPISSFSTSNETTCGSLIPSVIPTMMDTDNETIAVPSISTNEHPSDMKITKTPASKQNEQVIESDLTNVFSKSTNSVLTIKKEPMDEDDVQTPASKSISNSALISQLKSCTTLTSVNDQEKARPIMTSMLKEELKEKQTDKSILQIPQVPQHRMVQPNNPFIGQLPYMGHPVPMMMPNNFSVAYAPVLIPHGSHGGFYPYHNMRPPTSQRLTFPTTVSSQLQALQYSMAAMTNQQRTFMQTNKMNKNINLEKRNNNGLRKVENKKDLQSSDPDTALDFSLPKSHGEKDSTKSTSVLHSVLTKNELPELDTNTSHVKKVHTKPHSRKSFTATEQLKSLYTSVSAPCGNDSVPSIENQMQSFPMSQPLNQLKYLSTKLSGTTKPSATNLTDTVRVKDGHVIVNDMVSSSSVAGASSEVSSSDSSSDMKKCSTGNQVDTKLDRSVDTNHLDDHRKVDDVSSTDFVNKMSGVSISYSMIDQLENSCLTNKAKIEWLKNVQNELTKAKLKSSTCKQPSVCTENNDNTAYPFPIETTIDSDSLMIHYGNVEDNIRVIPTEASLSTDKKENSSRDYHESFHQNKEKTDLKSNQIIEDEPDGCLVYKNVETSLNDLTDNMQNLKCISSNIELPVISASCSTPTIIKCEPVESD
ncbi:uncharacterized protein LOC141898548 [Tubulanus polymorphus]|uniref:uncharacterized protein LOC141898548 n=1 Tax=Tubulanus polymorphus TaxID=672921 RepID=UPI003DA6372C